MGHILPTVANPLVFLTDSRKKNNTTCSFIVFALVNLLNMVPETKYINLFFILGRKNTFKILLDILTII